MDKIPCRVAGDLRRYMSSLNDAEVESFDEHQLEHVEAVVGKRLAPAVQKLLLLRLKVNDTQASFGVDEKRAFEAMQANIEQLWQLCRDEWRDL